MYVFFCVGVTSSRRGLALVFAGVGASPSAENGLGPAGATVGITCTFPQCGHLAFLPSVPSGARTSRPQSGLSQLNWIDTAGSFSKAAMDHSNAPRVRCLPPSDFALRIV